ncbi:MAG: peptide/nickel transport system permease protein [Solirubrobacteraceae bacterium]
MSGLTRLIVRRIVAVPLVVLGVIFVVFVAIDLSPNDPSTAVLGTFASKEAQQQFAAEHGLDDPLPVRFVRFLGDLPKGDLGSSVVRPEEVTTMIGQALPVTLQLTGLAMVIAIVVSLALGTVGALHRDRWPDAVARGFSAGGLAVPDFWLGILAIQFIAVKWRLLPSGGYVSFGEDPVQWLRSLILPASVLAVPVAAALTAVVRAAVVRELDRDYVRTARGNGLPMRAVVGSHVLRNAMLAPLTVVGVRAGYLLGGAIIVESIFGIPGMGTVLVNGIQQGDLAPVRGVAIVGALLFVTVNLIVDVLYLLLNPKLRHTA